MMQDEKILQDSPYVDQSTVEMLEAQREMFEEMYEASQDFIFDDYENEIQESERY